MRTFLKTLPAEHAKLLFNQLKQKNDALAQLFHYKLSTAVRKEMLEIIRQRSQSSPTSPTTIPPAGPSASEPPPPDEFGPIEPITSLEKARLDPRWVERNIVGDHLTTNPPYTYTLRYADGATLTVPLEVMSYRSLPGAKLTLFRRHLVSGRLVPFQISQDDAALRAPALQSLPNQLAMQRAVPPRFDPSLTPLIMGYLDQAQWLSLGRGMLEVFQLQLWNPLLLGFRPRLTGSRPRVAAGSKAAELTALRTEAQVLVQSARAGGRRVVVNLGGTGEVAGAINVNPLVSQQTRGIPNLIRARAERVGEILPAGSVDQVISNNIILGQVNWSNAARGAFTILRPGGTVSIAPYAGQIAEHLQLISQALRQAGFRNVATQAERLVTAVRP